MTSAFSVLISTDYSHSLEFGAYDFRAKPLFLLKWRCGSRYDGQLAESPDLSGLPMAPIFESFIVALPCAS